VTLGIVWALHVLCVSTTPRLNTPLKPSAQVQGSMATDSGAHGREEAAEGDDHNIVHFDGPDDPDSAINWPPARKWLNVFVLAAMTFIS
jgi:hypothetical protein